MQETKVRLEEGGVFKTKIIIFFSNAADVVPPPPLVCGWIPLWDVWSKAMGGHTRMNKKSSI